MEVVEEDMSSSDFHMFAEAAHHHEQLLAGLGRRPWPYSAAAPFRHPPVKTFPYPAPPPAAAAAAAAAATSYDFCGAHHHGHHMQEQQLRMAAPPPYHGRAVSAGGFSAVSNNYIPQPPPYPVVSCTCTTTTGTDTSNSRVVLCGRGAPRCRNLMDIAPPPPPPPPPSCVAIDSSVGLDGTPAAAIFHVADVVEESGNVSRIDISCSGAAVDMKACAPVLSRTNNVERIRQHHDSSRATGNSNGINSSDVEDVSGGVVAQLLQQYMDESSGESSVVAPEAVHLFNRLSPEKEELYRREAMKPLETVLLMSSSRSPVVEVNLKKYWRREGEGEGGRVEDAEGVMSDAGNDWGEAEGEAVESLFMEGSGGKKSRWKSKRKAAWTTSAGGSEDPENWEEEEEERRWRRRPWKMRRNMKMMTRISSDPQSVAARERRERIRERMEALRMLVPGGRKLDTAAMLKEATLYLVFLQAHLHRYLHHLSSSSAPLPPPPPPPPPPPS